MSTAIWVLGATGRSGSGIARRLHATGHRVVLAGRDAARLGPLANELGGAEVATGTIDSLVSQVHRAAPGVVVNTIGPFSRTAARLVAACPAGTHYVDIGNELPGLLAVLDQHDQAVAEGRTTVSSAGFGVLATESVAVHVCDGQPAPSRLRVDAAPSLATQQGVVGEALAASMLDGAPDGGRQVKGGRLVRSPVAAARRTLTTPDGATITTSSLPTGDLLAAWRASRAASVVSGSSAIPSGPAVRAVFPAVSLLMRSSALRRYAIARLARVTIPERPQPTPYSWGHALAEWSDGTTREAWLRMGDAQHFTESVAAEVARRLLTQQAPTGAYTPAALFGPSLATDLGAELVD